MRYSQMVAPRRSEMLEQPTPEPGPGEVLVAIKAIGVCASELTPWRLGEHIPSRLGHEPAGIVSAVGPGVSRFTPGDRVTGLFLPAFSDFEVTSQDNLIKIPDGLPYELALGEPIACLVNAQRRTPVQLGDRVAFIGAGFMGLGLLELIKLRGARQIIVIDPRREALDKALELGADEVYAPQAVPDTYKVTRWEDWETPRGVDVVIEASGTPAGLTLAGEMVRAHGILSILGFHQGGLRAVDVEMWNWKAIDVVNAHVRYHAHLMESLNIGLNLIQAGKFSLKPLVSHQFSLEDVDTAFTALLEKPSGFIKAVVMVA